MADASDGRSSTSWCLPPRAGTVTGPGSYRPPLRADSFTRATWWVPTTADELRAWLQAMGRAPDGVHASADGPSGILKLVRLHTDISTP